MGRLTKHYICFLRKNFMPCCSRKNINLAWFHVRAKSYLSEERMVQLKSNCFWHTNNLKDNFDLECIPFIITTVEKIYFKSAQRFFSFTFLNVKFSSFYRFCFCSVFKFPALKSLKVKFWRNYINHASTPTINGWCSWSSNWSGYDETDLKVPDLS